MAEGRDTFRPIVARKASHHSPESDAEVWLAHLLLSKLPAMGSCLVGGSLFDLPEAEAWVGTASRPDVFRRGAARRSYATGRTREGKAMFSWKRY